MRGQPHGESLSTSEPTSYSFEYVDLSENVRVANLEGLMRSSHCQLSQPDHDGAITNYFLKMFKLMMESPL